MTYPTVLVLPAQGVPLAVPTHLGDSSSGPARRKVESLGLTPVLRSIPAPRGLNALLWVAWVVRGEVPEGYDELSVADALASASCGPVVQALVDALARSRD